MARKPQDRSEPLRDPGEIEGLKNALDYSEPALPYNEAAKLRIGKVISDVVRERQPPRPRKP